MVRLDDLKFENEKEVFDFIRAIPQIFEYLQNKQRENMVYYDITPKNILYFNGTLFFDLIENKNIPEYDISNIPTHLPFEIYIFKKEVDNPSDYLNAYLNYVAQKRIFFPGYDKKLIEFIGSLNKIKVDDVPTYTKNMMEISKETTNTFQMGVALLNVFKNNELFIKKTICNNKYEKWIYIFFLMVEPNPEDRLMPENFDMIYKITAGKKQNRKKRTLRTRHRKTQKQTPRLRRKTQKHQKRK